MEKYAYFCSRFQSEITKRYARSAVRDVGNLYRNAEEV